MRWVPGLPVGVSLVAVLLALDGLASLVAAADLLVLATGDWVDIAHNGVIGAFLLAKAIGLWSLHRAAWLATTIVLVLKVVVGAYEITKGEAPLTAWPPLILSAIVVVYLFQPRIRARFSTGHTGRR
jgi:hypothetical protein